MLGLQKTAEARFELLPAFRARAARFDRRETELRDFIAGHWMGDRKSVV